MARWLFVACFLILVSFALVECKARDKRSKDKNRLKEETQGRSPKDHGGSKSSRNFRVTRFEVTRERAQKSSNVDDRVIFDDGDQNGELAVKLRDRLHRIPEKCDLHTLAHDKRRSTGAKADSKSARKTTRQPKMDQSTMELLFQDKKLNKLWEKADKAGFSADELSSLKTEFDHHQKKLDEYRAAKVSTGLSNLQPQDIAKLDAGIKDIIKIYGQLKAKVNKNAFVPDNGDFKEVRVEQLWKQALLAGFDRDELLSLREELSHFERKLQRLHIFRAGVTTERERDSEREKDSQAKVSERSDNLDMEHKVKREEDKIEIVQDRVEERITTHHSEL